MFSFRRRSTPLPPAPARPAPMPPEPIGFELSTEELEAIQQLFADEQDTLRHYGFASSTALLATRSDLLASFYQRAGAASVTGGTGVPMLVSEIVWVEAALRTLEEYKNSRWVTVTEARALLRRLHFAAGRATALRMLGDIPTMPIPDQRPALG